jgi:acetyl esterase/lipase
MADQKSDGMVLGSIFARRYQAQRHSRLAINASSEQLKGLPQTLLFVDENDVLRDEGEAYGRKCVRRGGHIGPL